MEESTDYSIDDRHFISRELTERILRLTSYPSIDDIRGTQLRTLRRDDSVS
jgi:hypothetical protein